MTDTPKKKRNTSPLSPTACADRIAAALGELPHRIEAGRANAEAEARAALQAYISTAPGTRLCCLYMARPIEPTPTLQGEDADRLRRDLANVCSPQEAERRIEQARHALDELTRPKFDLPGVEGADRKAR